MRNIMLDTESLGIRAGCVVLSIGAVEFFPDEFAFGEEFSVVIDPESCVEAGLKIEPRTVMWWMDQSDEARRALTSQTTVPLDEALVALAKAFDWKDTKVWCNGASFDFPILEAAYDAFDADAPWAYYNTMDYRTLKGLFSRKVYNENLVKPELAHDALSDAKAQATTAMNLLKLLDGVLK